VRLNHFVALAAGGSRREADGWIQQGRVWVNGEPPEHIGLAVNPTSDRVTLDGNLLHLPLERRYFAYHKPRGILVSRKGQGGRRTIFDALGTQARGLHAVGRLDVESEGLLLLTDDGDLSEALLHPRTALLRRYRIWVRPVPDPKTLRTLAAGTIVEDVRVAPRQVTHEGIEGGYGVLLIDLAEGKKREVRMLARAAGLDVDRLIRVQFGPILLGTLRVGALRALSKVEMELLRRDAFPNR
jgi:23S rRNA pseudouridine2605 synthase